MHDCIAEFNYLEQFELIVMQRSSSIAVHPLWI